MTDRLDAHEIEEIIRADFARANPKLSFSMEVLQFFPNEVNTTIRLKGRQSAKLRNKLSADISAIRDKLNARFDPAFVTISMDFEHKTKSEIEGIKYFENLLKPLKPAS